MDETPSRAHPDSSVHLAEDASNLTVTDFNTSSSTVVIIHGYTESHSSNTVQAIRDAYLHASDLNVVVINWWSLARGPRYEVAARNTKEVGRSLANFLDNLIRETQGAARRDLHIVGFSLGAQVAGIAAGQLTTGKLLRITALDPAKPIFEIRDDAERLDASDAEFVQVIHTASGFLSFLEPVGHADFYPNGGRAPQPPCPGGEALVCSHHMACTYFAESVYRPLSFPATLCDSWNNFQRGECDGNPPIFMGAFTPLSARGKFYLKTNSEAPYGQGKSTKTAEVTTAPSSNCSQSNMVDLNGGKSLCRPWTAEATESPSVEAQNDTQVHVTASTSFDENATITAVVVICFVLLSVLFILFFLVRHSEVVINFCRRTNVINL
ncbi:lipase member H isoform X2 [Cryptotermes secundus]|uniref:lipase member H isoform X2 n=1 Tax=Cryptotermes secundus TaxID=105785 RepID=UPI000CD7D272|nr:lipase member H isoform X2 [Cryptotermes secundus]